MARAPRVALVHEHLVQDGGAEQVLRVLMRMWPKAPLYTLLYDPKRWRGELRGRTVHTSGWQGFGPARRHYKFLLPAIDSAYRKFDFSDYDIVISDTSGWAKSVRTGPRTLHICYCHTPTRYIWSQGEEYIRETGYPAPLKAMFRALRPWLKRKDLRAARGVDAFVANSQTVAKRIKRYYHRDATVIHPPVDISKFRPARRRGGYFLLAGRLVPYKRNDVVVKTANELGVPLIVMGEGVDRGRLERRAGPTVRFTGRVSDARRRTFFAEAEALVNPQEEDFGLTPVEAMASGTPVIAYRKGGATEIITNQTGTFFDRQTPDAVARALKRFRPGRYRTSVLTAHARAFSVPRFRREFGGFIERTYKAYHDANRR